MNLELNFPVVGLDGNPLSKDSVGRVLAIELSTSNASPALLVQGWAEALWAGKSINLTGDEIAGFWKLVESSPRLPVLVRATIHRAMNHATAAELPQAAEIS